MGKSTKLEMFVCSKKTAKKIIGISGRFFFLNGWKEAEHGTQVAEIDEER